jgi:hypothetical protein
MTKDSISIDRLQDNNREILRLYSEVAEMVNRPKPKPTFTQGLLLGLLLGVVSMLSLLLWLV